MRSISVAALAVCLCFGAANLHANTGRPDLSSMAESSAWTITHATAETLQLDGKNIVRLVAEGDSAFGIVGLARPANLAFSTGTIEIDLRGKNVRQRSFLGVAFNVVDARTFEAVYFRPFNFKAEPPFNGRSVQYISWPQNTWEHLRKTAPGKFEATVVPVPDPDGWFHATVQVTPDQVRVFVNQSKEPSLVVARLSPSSTPRPVGLFVDSSDGMYSNLSVQQSN